MTAHDDRLLIAHVVFRFDVGGLENGVVNLLNRLPADRFRHSVVAMTEVTDFRRRVLRDDVQFISLHKAPGHGMRLWPALYRLFRSMRPDIVHTRNLAPLEACLPAWAAGVPARLHSEHGWDIGDLDGSNRAHRFTRRLYRPFVSQYVALSRHIEDYLRASIGVPSLAITQIYNGVDTQCFVPPRAARGPVEGLPFNDPRFWVIGTVGRLAAVKDQMSLIRALARMHRADAAARDRMRLVIVGDGPLRDELLSLAQTEGVADCVWLPGARSDIAQVMSGLDVFVLPSLAEGISNTLLEAMACGRPVIASAVGGNLELVDHDDSGTLVPAADEQALDTALLRYFVESDTAKRHGAAARAAVEARFSLDRMVADYAALYERVAARRVKRTADAPAKDSSFEPRTGH